MKTTKQAPLTIFGSKNLGGYCDPLTGECFASEEKENLMTTAIDPVCKMEVEIDTAQHKSEHAGQTYYFCSVGCQQAFEEDPHQYLPDDHHRKGYTHD